MHVCFCCVCFRFPLLSQEIGWEERLQNDLFCVGLDVKVTLSINTHDFSVVMTDTSSVSITQIVSSELLGFCF